MMSGKHGGVQALIGIKRDVPYIQYFNHQLHSGCSCVRRFTCCAGVLCNLKFAKQIFVHFQSFCHI